MTRVGSQRHTHTHKREREIQYRNFKQFMAIAKYQQMCQK